jgi:outer membrane protein TolC
VLPRRWASLRPGSPSCSRAIRRCNLALEHHLGDEATREDEALNAAKHTLNRSMSQYRDGVVSYLDVVTAQTTELQTQLVALSLQTRRLVATVGLIEALGGGWNVPSRVVNTSP